MDTGWVDAHQDRTPSSSDRLLTFLRELIRCDDADEQPREELLLAAGGCWREDDLTALFQFADERGLIGGVNNVESGADWVQILNLAKPSLNARIHVEEQLGEQGRSRQGFVAMWFDDSMNEAYTCGIEPRHQGCRLRSPQNRPEGLRGRGGRRNHGRDPQVAVCRGRLHDQHESRGARRRLLRGGLCLRARHPRFPHLSQGSHGCRPLRHRPPQPSWNGIRRSICG